MLLRPSTLRSKVLQVIFIVTATLTITQALTSDKYQSEKATNTETTQKIPLEPAQLDHYLPSESYTA